MTGVYLLLGSNLGNRSENLDKAAFFIQSKIGRIKKNSSVYVTKPWGFEHPNYFLNQAMEIETDLEPKNLMSEILKIEEQIGRDQRSATYSARQIDIDIIFYGDMIINERFVTIPHPYMQKRKFVLIPLCELNPGMKHPVLNKSIRNLLDECRDTGDVKIYRDSN
ncbi:MAG: 2-amino-4-hydroxy-6-hydroxymethyldihydropteridine diphosphokinase [Bacteroidales bacterium]|nr:MAG: 2-amino-4-hydroxy-6-hydroxymethyldihydropteridine diphosphokinase [Bacteroidales bacterium]